METKMQDAINYIDKIVKFYKESTDYENRQSLIGFGIGISKYCRMFYNIGTPEYEEIYKYFYNQLKDILEKSKAGTKDFIVEVRYTRGKQLHQHGMTLTERTEQEVRERAINRVSYRNNKPVKVKILDIDIKEDTRIRVCDERGGFLYYK